MGGFFVFIMIIVGFAYLYERFFGAERWCEVCNDWHIMKHKSNGNDSWYECSNCHHVNPTNGGCPRCGWYDRYRNHPVARSGPGPVAVDMFNSIWGYEEIWKCPKHGRFQLYVPAGYSESSFDDAYDDYDDDEDYQRWCDSNRYDDEDDYRYNDYDVR